MATAAVSVLVPVYNAAPYLAEALGSIARQSFTDLEIIVVDDGSTDGSDAILREFAASDPRCRLLSRDNRGLIATRNELLAAARAEFVAWMDADDISLPTRIDRQVALLRARPEVDCVGCDARLIDPQGRPLSRESYPEDHASIVAEQAKGSGLRFPTTMVRREAALRAGGFREPFRIGEDFDFLLRVAEAGELANIAEELFLYRQHLAGTCVAFGGIWIHYRDEILALAAERRASGRDRLQRGECLVLPSPKTGSALRRAPEVLAHWSAIARAQGDRRRAREYAGQAIASGPLSRQGWRALWHSVRPRALG